MKTIKPHIAQGRWLYWALQLSAIGMILLVTIPGGAQKAIPRMKEETASDIIL